MVRPRQGHTECHTRGGVEKKFAPGKNFRGGLGSRALPAKKKLSQYFHSIWNFFCKV